jgi:hypothetical protein
MINSLTPLKTTPALDTFFSVEKTQCLCYKMPSYEDGWVIQGLGQIEVKNHPMFGDTAPLVKVPEYAGMEIPLLCAVGVKVLLDWFA